MFSLNVAALLATATMLIGVQAAPTADTLGPLDVWVPKILTPTAGDVWEANSTVSVTWDTSDAPGSISNVGSVRLLRGGENTGLILAFAFDLRAGSVEFPAPWMVDGDEYQIVLFGDSGNVGDEFTIHSGIVG